MARFRCTPGVDAAASRLAAIAEQALAAGRQFLPSLTECVTLTGFSRVTVHRAVLRLADDGVLSVQPHRGIHINRSAARTPTSSPPRPAPAPRPRWAEISDALSAELLAGRFPPGTPLPASKQLSREHCATRRTIVRALEDLVSLGRLEPFGRGHRVPRAAAEQSGASLVVVAAVDSMQWLAQATPRAAEFWRCLQQECHHRRLRVAIAPSAEVLGRGPRSGASLAKRGAIGFALLPLTVPQTQLRALLPALLATGRPVTVLDETASLETAGAAVNSPLLKVFVMATSSAPGHAVGQYLLELGHRRVAFVSAGVDDLVGRRRREGLAAAFADAGVREPVTAAHPEPALDVERCLNSSPDYSRYRREVMRQSAMLVRKLSGRQREVPVDDFTWAVARREILAKAYGPVFARLLEGDATAWACYNDELGLLALDFLRERRMAVPGQVSVVGFDDTLAALSAGLTSYNFNVPAVVSAMLDHILAPRPRAHAARAGVVEVPGMVMGRASSGRAK